MRKIILYIFTMDMIDKNINNLKEPFRTKCKVFLQCIHTKYPNIEQFETLRTKSRQLMLLSTGKTWTLNSYHIKWLACDRVFMKNWQPTRSWDYYFLQWIATMCGMTRIKQELCHTQDLWNTIENQIYLNSQRYIHTADAWEQYRLHLVNKTFREYLTPTK